MTQTEEGRRELALMKVERLIANLDVQTVTKRSTTHFGVGDKLVGYEIVVKGVVHH
jgi:hypothetical protein